MVWGVVCVFVLVCRILRDLYCCLGAFVIRVDSCGAGLGLLSGSKGAAPESAVGILRGWEKAIDSGGFCRSLVAG